MSTLVYVHGTNGSGKSTLARAVIAAAGGSIGYEEHANKPDKCGSTYTGEGLVLMGKYERACGGVDGISPYVRVHEEMKRTAEEDGDVFAEGLITPGVETCKQFVSYFDRAVFIMLATPEEKCIEHVLRRRRVKGNTKPYDTANLYRKAQSARSWADRLETVNLDVRRLQYRAAYDLILELFGLQSPSVDDLL